MRFKHYISILIAGAALSVACQKNETEVPTTPVEITFAGGDASDSRAFQNLSHDYQMRVTALYHDTGVSKTYYYFEDAPFKWNNDKGAWAANDGKLYYYPLSGTMDFVALATKPGWRTPVVEYTPSTTAELTDSSLITGVVFDYTDEDRQLDGTEDHLASVGTEEIACSSAVSSATRLDFCHLLSNVRFEFYAETEEAVEFLQVTGITLLSTHLSGVASVTRTSKNIWNVSWPSLTDTVNIRRDVAISPVYGSTEYPYIDFFVPTQPVTGFKMHIRYYVGGGAYVEEFDYMTRNFPSPDVWHPGVRYIYRIECILLPHVEFRVNYVDGESGVVLDEWEMESITLDPQ